MALNNLDMTPAERSLWDITTPDGADRQFRRKLLSGLPEQFVPPIAAQYRALYEASGLASANNFLVETTYTLKGETLRLASSDDDLCLFAKRRAQACRSIKRRYGSDIEAYQALTGYAEGFGILAPAVNCKRSVGGAIGRLGDDVWWRRQLRKTHGRTVEGHAVTLGLVHQHAQKYASDATVQRRKEQKARNRELLESIVAVNEFDQEFTLQALSDKSVSKPANRRNELMTRIAGFEEIARALGHVGVFITISCPSRMHARYAASGAKNSRHDNTTPRQANDYLNKQWQKMRAKCARQGLYPYGFRVAEPHHDATPHWHLLLFLEPEKVDALIAICRHYALEVDGDEKGAQERRLKVERIDWTKGTAAGYIAKYISKNIDGHGLDCDLDGKDPVKAAQRIDAWASTWGIHQFQQIGGPSVTGWRMLRRMETSSVPLIEDARQAADAGNWTRYVTLMGGPQARRVDMPIKLYKVQRNKAGRYGEPIHDQVIGVEYRGEVTKVRIYQWKIRRGKPRHNIRVEGTDGAPPDSLHNVTLHYGTPEQDSVIPFSNVNVTGNFTTAPKGAVVTWSSVNNCTQRTIQ